MVSNSSPSVAADFAGWQRMRPEMQPEAWRLLGITPFERPDLQLAHAFHRQRAALALDIGRDSGHWPAVWQFLEQLDAPCCGLRVPDHVALDVDEVPAGCAFVILTAERALAPWCARFPVLVQVGSRLEAKLALAAGAQGLIAKSQESGGWTQEVSSLILLQQLQSVAEEACVPLWLQGGIGLNTAAAAIAGGAFGVVLDSQLALLAESSLPEQLKSELRNMDGSQVRYLGGYGCYAKPAAWDGLSAEITGEEVRERFKPQVPDEMAMQWWPMGQDAALAAPLAAQCPNVEALLHSLRLNIAGHLRQARALDSLGEHSPWARAHGTRFPIAQGPMTRVSDNAGFAAAVAREGALPFLALSLLTEPRCRELLAATKDAVGGHSWGVGVLGFADAAVLGPQLKLIEEFRPNVVLLAGGRPSQARALVEQGIPAYLHVPSPGLLSLFLKEGARHFVFEGRECGGHVGPRYSFTLWEQQLQVLQGFDQAHELHLLFAGGIHDARSAAMVAALTAPLAARGAKIAVLMGSAYIMTHEAVATGAVLDYFQRRVLQDGDTVLLETGPGHATRCLRSGYVDFFASEKLRLQAAGVDAQNQWQQLEALNVGRLRLASKGVRREGERLLEVSEQEQEAAGMYMIGQVAGLRQQAVSLAQLHEDVSRGARKVLVDCQPPALPQALHSEPIAIVGMACIYPGAADLESYWGNIVAGRDLVREVPASRWNAELYYQAGEEVGAGKTPSKWGGFIDPQPFDPLRYGIPPQSLAAIEPVQLLSLEVASRALQDAGYRASVDGKVDAQSQLRWFDREKTSVIFGAESGTDLSNAYAFRNQYPHYLGALPAELDAVLPELTEDSFPGVLVNVISGRIANRLGLGGVNYSVDAACASSLTAIELAVKELRSGSSDMVLAGGADFHNSVHDYLLFASVKALSPTGRCRSFDASADGICLGEGVGVVVLKRLSDAQRAGDRIYAVIEGIAGSSDGKGLGLTAPRKEGQKRALERAYWQAGVLPGDVGLVEAHGTGTVVGDRTELQTLSEIFNAGGALPGQATLGSVKSQIGHTKCAAGIAGLIKVAKALHHRVLPPTLHVDTPNPGHDARHSPFVFQRQAQPWSAPHGRRRAAISAFGFGGTNFHAVLAAHDVRPPRTPHAPRAVDVADATQSGVAQWGNELFLFRGERIDEATEQIRQLSRFLRESDAPLLLRDLAFSQAQLGQGPVQCALVAQDIADLRRKLEAAQQREKCAEVYYRQTELIGKLAFLFPGQGSQSPGMLQDLFVAFPELQTLLRSGQRWLDVLFPAAAHTPEAREAQQRAITDTRVAQPCLGMANSAMAQLLRGLGLQPDMLAGHSYGELVALAQAGCYSVDELLQLSEQRGLLILEAAGSDPGRMAAVSAGREQLEALFPVTGPVVLANQNSPQQTVISGPAAAIDEALDRLKAEGISARPIEVACAFHSPLVAAAEPRFAALLDAVDMQAPQATVYSNVTASPYPADVATMRQQLAAQIACPVRFVDMIEAMYADGARLFVEVGPGRVLSALVSRILGERPHQMVATDQKGQSGIAQLLAGVAQLAVALPAQQPGLDARMLWAGRQPRELDFSQAQKLPATCWLVDGARAWPRQGEAPRQAGKIMLQPLQQSDAHGVLAPAGAPLADQTVAQYLHNMRGLVEAQRDVMLGLLGAAVPAPVAGVATRMPAAAVPSSAAVSVVPGVATAMAQVTTALTADNTHQDVRQILLQIVSERTGYPVDMLDPELDLEADLSIDSIKRIEIMGELSARIDLRAHLGTRADALMEELTAQKTLHAMGNWLDDHVAAPNSQLTAAVPPAPGPLAAAISGAARLDVRQVLLNIVSERTGYPEDVLDLDLDLEADLSIDSIKRLEIVGELSERLELKSRLQDKSVALEELTAQKTLRAIVSWLQASLGEGAVDQGALAAVPLAETDVLPDHDADGAIALARYVMRPVVAPAAVRGRQKFAGKHFLITDDELGVAPRLAERLQEHGASVEVISFSEHAPPPESLDHVDGLIHLFNLSAIARVRDIKRFFDLVRETLLNKASCLLVASGLGGRFGQFAADQLPDDFGHGAGLAGMLKSVAKEWPEVRVHCVDLDPDESAEELADYLEIELLAENPLTEVSYLEGSRHYLKAVESALPLAGEINHLQLDRNSVVMLTGGARGITAQLAVALARRFGCQLELVGRSPLPADEETQETRAAQDLKALRQVLVRMYPGLKPVEIEQRCSQILAARDIRATFAAIEAAGGRVNYTALDVRDIDVFAAHIEQLYRQHGRIDGVIHGAGVIEDKLLRNKSAASFQRVFDTKVRGALMIHKLIRDDVKFVVFFSSVAGAFGNKGQVDYASANDVLDKIAHALRARVRGRVLSVNWGPWASTGMVSAELEREYARKGIGLIPLEEGVEALLRELQYGTRDDTQVVFMCATPESMDLVH